MKKYFTTKGIELFRRRIERQRQRALNAQRETGAAAGDSCDWHDNFGYEEARRRSEMEANTLNRLSAAADGAIIFDPPEQDVAVRIGNTVRFMSHGDVKEVTIGAYGEVDIDHGLVSYESPLASSLLGKRKGDVVNLEKGEQIFVESILPPSYRYRTLIESLVEKEP